MKDIREQIYEFIDLYVDTTEPKKLCSSIQDLVEELAESKVKNLPMHGVRNCRKCGNPHWLRDEDAGSEREMERLCIDCF